MAKINKPFNHFLIGNRKFRVIRMGNETKGQQTIIVKQVMICAELHWPTINNELLEFSMKYPIINDKFVIIN